MIWLIIFIFIFIACPFVPFAIKHFYPICVNAASDIYKYIKHKEYNRCHFYGRVYLITAYRNKVFGSGKTLDMVKMVRDIYKRYNGLLVWSEDEQKLVTQHIHIISNVTLTDIPYTPFKSVAQLKNVEQGTEDITIFVFDEVGAIWNSRNYKDNISTELLKRLLQVRKNKIAIVGTAQRFKFVDALLRQITGTLICVRKWWRILKLFEYDPVSFEACDNIDMLKPVSVKYSFIYDKDYNSYDTSEIVESLSKEEMLPDAEVLQNQGVHTPDIDFATGIKLRFRKRKR